MGLSAQQRKELQKALVDAFPTKSSLEQMLSFELDRNLEAIAGERNLQEIVFKIIQTAEAEEWIEDLIRAAHRTNPRNPKLKAIAQELLRNPDPEKSPIPLTNNPPEETNQLRNIAEEPLSNYNSNTNPENLMLSESQHTYSISSQSKEKDSNNKKGLNFVGIVTALLAIAFIITMITMFIMFLQLSQSNISLADVTVNSNPKIEQPDQEMLSNQDHHSSSPENSKIKVPNLECYDEDLRKQLEGNEFKKADKTTLRLMQLITNQYNELLNRHDILCIKCQDFYKIDSCWKQKNPNFGFSVQTQIWKEMRDKEKVADDKIYGLFAKRVGWNVQEKTFKVPYQKVTCNDLNDEKNIPQGNLPCLINQNIYGQAPAPAYIQEKVDECNNLPRDGSVN